ncbi:hypothetical protein C8R48DRAFT_612469 [Suillus tomentosus]|nr:hypothetical protein C8R48DRAFT_612469 [Suillus tomentosus]
MHYAGANMASLYTDLWRGTMDCSGTDTCENWPWVVLIGDTWEEHGHAVTACKSYLPGSFEVAPCDPNLKMNSFYKAVEYIMWLYYLCPALLYGILPDNVWQNFCKFVTALRIMSQYRITPAQIAKACQLFADWEHKFELLYYQHRFDRIHMIRPCAHLSNHVALECTRVGSPICSSQWTMEWTIGNLGQQIRQPSDPFSNLAQQGIRRCQINALKAMLPQFDHAENLHPRGSRDLGNGYILLTKSDKKPVVVNGLQSAAIADFLGRPSPKFCRWARLHLPNGQIARSAWTETQKSPEDVCMARNIKEDENNRHFVNVALVTLYSLPQPELLALSYGALISCIHEGEESLCVIDINTIQSVVGMIPHKPTLPNGQVEEQFFLVEKTGLDIARCGLQDDNGDID